MRKLSSCLKRSPAPALCRRGDGYQELENADPRGPVFTEIQIEQPEPAELQRSPSFKTQYSAWTKFACPTISAAYMGGMLV